MNLAFFVPLVTTRAGCRAVVLVAAPTNRGVGGVKSSLGREQCSEMLDVERAICCVETRKEIREGERQSPETELI